jgi:hypothetical protein
MSSADLNALEREVELTRAKFADDLARLRSPHNLTEFKDDLWAHARERKNGIVADWKARAAANPLAVAAIAAGVGWRLFQRPPIATLLVGLGLVGLLRTSPSPEDYATAEDWLDPEKLTSRAAGLAAGAKHKVRDWREQAREASTQVAETVSSVAERASEALRQGGDTARARVTELTNDATPLYDQASAKLRAAMPDAGDRKDWLLGAAALAVAAAVGIAFQRRAHENS